MKKHFYLVRHGKKVKQIGDPPLSEVGIEEAKLTGEFFKTFDIDKIVSSPIKRSKETAEYISKATNLPFEINDLLKERVNWGDDPNQSFTNFLVMWERASKERSWQPPVGDSSENSGKRMEKIIDDLLPTKYSEIILVTHGGIIGDYLKNIFPAQVLKQFTDVDFTYDDAIPECSITTIVYNMDKNKIELKELASIKHLLVGDKISL